MSDKKPHSETSRQYGVTYPDGRTFWTGGDDATGRFTSFPGSRRTEALTTLAEREIFMEDWRYVVAACGLDPSTVPQPKFVTREIVRSVGDASEVSDS